MRFTIELGQDAYGWWYASAKDKVTEKEKFGQAMSYTDMVILINEWLDEITYYPACEHRVIHNDACVLCGLGMWDVRGYIKWLNGKDPSPRKIS